MNEILIETKHWQFSEKTLVPNAIKGLGDIERDYSALTTGFLRRGPDIDSISRKIASRPGFSKAILVIRKKIFFFKVRSCLVMVVSIVLDMSEVIEIGR